MQHAVIIIALHCAVICPLRSATSYLQDFNALPDGTTAFADGSLLVSDSGEASVQNGALRLTLDGSGEERGTFYIPGIDGASGGWTASFSVRLDSESLPADGFSFSWGRDIPIIPYTGGDEEGWGIEVDHLFFGFDTFDNGGGEWGFRIGSATGLSEMTFTALPGELIGSGEAVTAQVAVGWNPVTGASFLTNGFRTDIAVSGIPVSGFTAADGNTFVFSARTGGLTETLVIDNIDIRSVPEPGPTALLLAGAVLLLRRPGKRSLRRAPAPPPSPPRP